MNILITRHDKIGDFVTALPMCKALKEQTQHRIIMLVAPINVELAKKMPFIDEVMTYSDDIFAMAKQLRNQHIDVSISAYIDVKLGLSLRLARIPKRIAPATKIAQLLFNKTLKQRRSQVTKTEWAYNLDLLKVFDPKLSLTYQTPLLQKNDPSTSDFIIFHPGFGGSSDGNLNLDDYLSLAKQASKTLKVCFTFGPDDAISKAYIKQHLDFKATIRDDFTSLWRFTQFIATAKLFISTSTGPMHLAGLTNTSTFSFFGDNLFASSKRWATVSETSLQHNIELPPDYDTIFFQNIQRDLIQYISSLSSTPN